MNHQHYLGLAAQAAATVNPQLTSPNPRVGCVVVKNNQVIATGVHQKIGEAHAEAHALSQIDPAIVPHCQVYITLEPCVNFKGKQTPSCTDRLLALKPDCVIIGALDPHFPGKGLAALKAAGINTKIIKSSFHNDLNPWFNTWITQNRPHITLKIAQSLDGKITNGKQYLTNALSRERVHLMRAHHSAILTTTKTVLADNPKLDTRLNSDLEFSPTNPDIIVMGKSHSPQDLKIHQTPERKIHALQSHNLEDLIKLCKNNGYSSILTECGGTLNSALLDAGLVDQIELFIAPTVLGKAHVPSFNNMQVLADFDLTATHSLGSDFQLVYKKRH